MREEDLIKELESLSRYLGHDMKGPVRAIRFYSDSGLEEAEDDNSKDSFEKINRSGIKLNLLLQQTHIELRALLWKLKPLEVDLVAVSKEVCEKYNLTLRSELDSYKLNANYSLLFELLQIIIHNSYKWISTNKQILLVQSEDDVFVKIGIRDYGYGFPKDGDNKKALMPGIVLDRLDSRSGNGFGLYFAQLIMNKIGGEIEVRTNLEGRGVNVQLKFIK